MELEGVKALTQSHLSRYWDLSVLLILAFADGGGNPSMTLEDSEGDTFASSSSSNLGPCASKRRKSTSFKSASVTYVLGNMSQ